LTRRVLDYIYTLSRVDSLFMAYGVQDPLFPTRHFS